MTYRVGETSQKEAALALADEVLADIELSRLPPVQVVRKASRLARLLNDEEAMTWLAYETTGYTLNEDNKFTPGAWRAALRSKRARFDNGALRALSGSLGQLQASIDAGLARLAVASDPNISISSQSVFNPAIPAGNTHERLDVSNLIVQSQQTIDAVVGSVHQYIAARYHELRFGAAVESAFEVVRSGVDEAIGALVPAAMPMLAAAFENASAANPELRAGAAATCRRLLKTVADALQPPGESIGGREMTDAKYINRLAAWIEDRIESGTARDLVIADLEYLGRRLDAVDDAGHKGAHAEVSRLEAARYVTGTYLLLGDVLQLKDPEGPPFESGPGSEDEAPPDLELEEGGAPEGV